MAWGRAPRYCCVNTADRCAHALRDSLFSQAQHDAWGGRCQGTARAPGCGQPLAYARLEDLRSRWALSGMLAASALVAAAVAARIYIFPAPLAGVAFATDRSRTDESTGQVVLEIRRARELTAAAQVRTSFVDGTAKAGVDYEIPGPTAVFQPGQDRARVLVPILPDATLRKGERYFSVVLDNVEGRPRHVAVIAPRQLDTTAQMQVEQMVLNASRLAADIAGYAVKVETMEQLLNELRESRPEFQEFRRQMRDSADNLVRAREAYLQAVHALRTQPPRDVLATIDRLATDLRNRDFKQQSRVLPVLGRQYGELVQGKAADMDRWVRELSQTIDRVAPERPRT